MADLLYARYSSHAQDDGTSIEVQVEICERAAGGPCRHYIDRARTGRSIHGRDALHRMIADAREGDTVWVHKWDRLGRDAGEAHLIIRDLEDKGVRVQAVGDGNDPLGRGVQLVVAEHYSRALAQRTREGLLKVFERGEHIGGLPAFGWQVINSDQRRVLAKHPAEAVIVRKIVEMYLKNKLGFKAIAAQLNRDGDRTRSGRLWSQSSVRWIVANEQNRGIVFFNRRTYRVNRKTGRRVFNWRRDDQVISRADESLRLISDEEWSQITDRLAKRSAKGTTTNSLTVRPFTGQIICSICGTTCVARKSSNAKGTYYYYACGKRQRQGVTACSNSATIREDLLLGNLQSIMRDIWQQADRLVEAAVARAAAMIGSHREELAANRSLLADLDRRISKMAEAAVESTGATRRAFLRQIGELEAQREQAHRRSEELAAAGADNAESLARSVKRALAEANETILNVASPAETHDIIKQIWGPMTLNADGRLERRPHAPGCIAGAGIDTWRMVSDLAWSWFSKSA